MCYDQLLSRSSRMYVGQSVCQSVSQSDHFQTLRSELVCLLVVPRKQVNREIWEIRHFWMPVVRLVAQQYAVSVILLIGDCTVEHVIIAAVTPLQGPAVFGCMQQQCWILFALRFFVVAESMPVVPTSSRFASYMQSPQCTGLRFNHKL